MCARYVSVIPLATLINWFVNWRERQREPHIPKNYQLMIWWAGLRGAIAFALSYDVQGPDKLAIQTTILIVCVVSIILLGSTTPFALSYLAIQTGVGELHSDDEEEELELRGSFDSDFLPSRPTHWFLNFDDTYLKPVFTRDSVGLNPSPSRNQLLRS
jgi:NhaP-type Na+/H+ or K+/H+ antiporter